MIRADRPIGIASKETERLSPFGASRLDITFLVEEIALNTMVLSQLLVDSRAGIDSSLLIDDISQPFHEAFRLQFGAGERTDFRE